jgi:hypothetical protein
MSFVEPQRVRRWLVSTAWCLALVLSTLATAAPTLAVPGMNRPAGRDAASGAPGWNPNRPPFRVAGIVVGPNMKLVQVIVPDASGRGGRAVTLKEGATLEGFLIKKIEKRQIYVEKGGSEIRLGLGNPHPLQEPPEPEEKGQIAHRATAPGGTASHSPADALKPPRREPAEAGPAGAGGPPEPPPETGHEGEVDAPPEANGG